jgi:hypothetical protein
VDNDALLGGVLAKADFKGSVLGAPNTDVLPNAFGVVARLEKADFMGCDKDDAADVPLNGLEGMDGAGGFPNTDDGVGLGPKLLVSNSEALGWRDVDGSLEVVWST